MFAVEACYRDDGLSAVLGRVLETMGFGNTFRAAVAMLHAGATVSFLLQWLSCYRCPLSYLSARGGPPLAALLFIMQVEPFLFVLRRLLPGLPMGSMNDVDPVGECLKDGDTRRFEALSGQILDRNWKFAILGNGRWRGTMPQKVSGVRLAPSLDPTMAASWAAYCRGVTAALNFWATGLILTLRLRLDAMKSFAKHKALLQYLCIYADPGGPAAYHGR